MICHIDFETKSQADLKKVGAHKYAADLTTGIWVLAYAFDDGPVHVWSPMNPAPLDLLNHVKNGGEVHAHNAAFELAIWDKHCVVKYGWPLLKPEQCRCTMAMALAMGLPASLDAAAKAVNLTIEKDEEGKRLMLRMCQAANDNWSDGDVERLAAYCIQDVEVERQLEKRLAPLSKREQMIWEADQHINERGIFVDIPTIQSAIDIAGFEKEKLNKKLRKFIDINASQVAAITTWVNEQGYELPSLTKADMAAALDDRKCPAIVKEVIEIRQEFAKASNAKLQAMATGADNDNRIRGTHQYWGAHTGRWAGRRIQPQNLPRPTLENDEINDAITLITSAPNKLKKYGQPLTVLSNCIRGMITAPEGYELIAVDFSQIEARVLAWLANDTSTLNVFNRKEDIYLDAASKIYGEEITKDDDLERQVGKVATLALGYQGGVGAFQQMSKSYGLKVTNKRADTIKKAWRESHPAIEKFWYETEYGAVSACAEGIKEVKVSKHITFLKSGSFLQCRLPSGRKLTYPYPHVEVCGFYKKGTSVKQVREHNLVRDVEYIDKDDSNQTWEKPTLFYRSAKNGQFIQHSTYGGSLVENITQAIARDLLAWAMMRFEKHGLKIVMHVHDEIVVEAPEGSVDLNHALDLMKITPFWAGGLPLAADGWIAKRFKK